MAIQTLSPSSLHFQVTLKKFLKTQTTTRIRNYIVCELRIHVAMLFVYRLNTIDLNAVQHRGYIVNYVP